MENFEKAKSEIIKDFNKSESKTRTKFNEIVASVCDKYRLDPFSILYSLGMA